MSAMRAITHGFLFYDVIPNEMRDLPKAHLLIHDCAQRLD